MCTLLPVHPRQHSPLGSDHCRSKGKPPYNQPDLQQHTSCCACQDGGMAGTHTKCVSVSKTGAGLLLSMCRQANKPPQTNYRVKTSIYRTWRSVSNSGSAWVMNNPESHFWQKCVPCELSELAWPSKTERLQGNTQQTCMTSDSPSNQQCISLLTP